MCAAAAPYRVACVHTYIYIRSARGYTTRVKEVEGIEESLALVVANGCRRAADGATVAWRNRRAADGATVAWRHRRADELGMKAAAAGRVSLCRPCLSIMPWIVRRSAAGQLLCYCRGCHSGIEII